MGYQTSNYQSRNQGEYSSQKTAEYKSRKKCTPCIDCGYC